MYIVKNLYIKNIFLNSMKVFLIKKNTRLFLMVASVGTPLDLMTCMYFYAVFSSVILKMFT